jgi:hypothetical protein
MGIKHATAAPGTESGDGKISKNAWDEEHVATDLLMQEVATDGSDTSNPDADYRRLFLGEDGALHLKDSAGAVTSVAAASVAADVIWDAKGDLAGGIGSNSADRLAVGSNGHVLMADSSASTGLRWGAILPEIANYASTYSSASTSNVVTMTQPTAGDVLVAIVTSRGRGCNSITQTNVTWTQRYTGNGNSQYIEVWTGVVSAAAGTTATFAFTGTNNQQCATFQVVGSSAFTSVSSSGTATAAATALSSLSVSNLTVGNWYIAVCSANSPTSSYGSMTQPVTSLSMVGGAMRAGIFRPIGTSLTWWSLSSSAVDHFTAVVALS